VRPWLPLGDTRRWNVDDQRDDSGSVLNLCRDLIALRRAEPELAQAPYVELDAPAGVWAWRRGDWFAVAVNLSHDPVSLETMNGRIAIATDRGRDGETVSGELSLEPHQGAIVSG
jgi:alpha-glucosidase